MLAIEETVKITDDDVNAYWEKGYWISPRLLTDEQLEKLREAVDRVVQGERDFDSYYYWEPPPFVPDSPAIIQVINGWWVNAEVRRMVTSPVIGYIGSRLMKTPSVRVWHDQVLYKPGVGPEGAEALEGNIGWHQDYAYWQCANTSNFVTAWIALQDTDLSNGGMRTIVGSHAWGLNASSTGFKDKNLDELRQRFAAEGRTWQDEACELKAGQVSFHHSLVYHGSGPNLSRQPRRSIVVHMMSEGCGLQKNKRYHRNAALLGPYAREGDLFEGPFFPQIWPAAEDLSG